MIPTRMLHLQSEMSPTTAFHHQSRTDDVALNTGNVLPVAYTEGRHRDSRSPTQHPCQELTLPLLQNVKNCFIRTESNDTPNPMALIPCSSSRPNISHASPQVVSPFPRLSVEKSIPLSSPLNTSHADVFPSTLQKTSVTVRASGVAKTFAHPALGAEGIALGVDERG